MTDEPTRSESLLGRVFDAYQNVSQIARCLTISARLRGVNRPRVLELSRRTTGLADFTPTADVVRYATHEREQTILAPAVALPFRDGEFDGCVVTDMYEHIPEDTRQGLLAEMVRVTRGVVLVGTPTETELVTRFDRVVFDFVWGKYGEVFEPLAQHSDFGFESLAAIEQRFARLGASRVAALPCNYVYRWIHQLLVYFDLQHRHPHGDLFEAVNRAYNEHVSPYDYREPCYRYLLVVPTDASLDLDALTTQMQGPVETPAAVAEAEGVLLDAFRAVDARASDRLRRYTQESDVVHAELDRLGTQNDQLQAEHARLLANIGQLQADNRWALDEIAALRSQDELLGGLLGEVDGQMAALLASRRWRIGDRVVTAARRALGRRSTERSAEPAERLLERVRGWRLRLAADVPISDLQRDRASLVQPWDTPHRRRYDVVVLANVDWHTRRQRPQHLAAAIAAEGHRVFYVVSSRWLPPDHPVGYELTLVARGVWQVVLSAEHDPDRYAKVADGGLVEAWLHAFDRLRGDLGIEHAAVHVHLPSWAPLAFALRAEHDWPVVYDCMDEFVGFPGIGEAVLRAEPELAAGADLVVVTAEVLRQKWAPSNHACVLVRNAVDATWFAATAGPSDLLAETERPVIGFLGGIADWLDLGLIAAVAKAHPEWSFVLVGDTFVQDLAGLDTLPNVRLTGLRPYEEMPLWLFSFDVAIMPFRVDHISAAVDPVKFYEYFALGLPVVTTPLPELEEHREHLYVAEGAADFASSIEKALGEPLEHRTARVAVATANTWEDRYRVLDAATTQLWPAVSVVVVTHGRLDLTRPCIDSLLANTGHPRWELVVVDNASRDGTPAYLRHLEATQPDVRVVLNGENRGFPAACNQGLALAGGDVLVVLNNDTVVPPGWLAPLLEHLDDPSIGIVGPRSNRVGNEARLEVSYVDMDEMTTLAARLRRDRAGESFDIHMLAFLCVAVRRDVFKKVGPLDEGYGVGLFEDDDYAERVRRVGLRVVCAADAFVHHVGQGTFESLLRSGEYDELWDRNKARFEARWGPWRAQGGDITSGAR